IQYTHARIQSVLSKGRDLGSSFGTIEQTGVDAVSLFGDRTLTPSELDLIQQLSNYSNTIASAAKDFSPAIVANYAYELAKTFNKFYHEETILKAEVEAVRDFRLLMSAATAA